MNFMELALYKCYLLLLLLLLLLLSIQIRGGLQRLHFRCSWSISALIILGLDF